MTIAATVVAHFSALVPVAWVHATQVRGSAYYLVAYGFFVSFAADVLVWTLGGSWAVLQWYPVVQFSLFAAAFGAWGIVLLLPWIALLQAWGVPGPDMMVTALGSVAVLYVSDRHPLRASMLWYCGVASAMWILMVPARESPELFMWFWWPYQFARLTAFGLFARAALLNKTLNGEDR